METISYPYRKNKPALPFGILLLCFSIPVLCVLAGLAVLFIFKPSTVQAFLGIDSPAITCVGLIIMDLLFLFMGIRAIYLSQVQMEAILTPETFSYGRRGHLTTIRLAEITRVTGKRIWWYNSPDLAVTIEDTHGRMIFMRKTPWDKYTGGFDYRAILRDLLPRLPSTAQMNQKVRDLVETGRY